MGVGGRRWGDAGGHAQVCISAPGPGEPPQMDVRRDSTRPPPSLQILRRRSLMLHRSIPISGLFLDGGVSWPIQELEGWHRPSLMAWLRNLSPYRSHPAELLRKIHEWLEVTHS